MEVALYKLNTKRRLDSLKDTGISETNQKLILSFVNYCFSEGIGEHRALKYLSTLKIMAEFISTNFDKATEDEIRAYTGSIERSTLSNWTKHDYKVMLKDIYRWLNGGEEPVTAPAVKTAGIYGISTEAILP